MSMKRWLCYVVTPTALLILLVWSVMGPVTASETAVLATEEKIIVSLAQDAPTWLDDRLYTLDPDGTDLTPYFDFAGQPKVDTGRMIGLRSDSDGRALYFHSTHLFAYTPAYFNVFQLDRLGKSLDQVTPGANSGDFSQTGNSTVSGFVRNNIDTPYIGTPVYLEGVGTVNTGGDGSFSFNNVPAGARWLVAYNNVLDRWEARAITVVANLNTTGLVLVPDTTSRMNFTHPVPYNGRIYYRGNFGTEINWTDTDFAGPTTVYTSPSDPCTGVPTVDAFDVHSSGKIVLLDYQEGCGGNSGNHAGIYTIDSDGSNKQLLVNMLADANYGAPLEAQIFWSPDGTRIAVKLQYAFFEQVFIYNTSGTFLGNAAADTGSATVTLYGWSPAGDAILFGEYDGDAADAVLGKIVVNPDGSFGAATILLSNRPISGATWGNLLATQDVYLPMVIR